MERDSGESRESKGILWLNSPCLELSLLDGTPGTQLSVLISMYRAVRVAVLPDADTRGLEVPPCGTGALVSLEARGPLEVRDSVAPKYSTPRPQ